eukprot:217768-Pelagomonas_calceolata.AAC.1
MQGKLCSDQYLQRCRAGSVLGRNRIQAYARARDRSSQGALINATWIWIEALSTISQGSIPTTRTHSYHKTLCTLGMDWPCFTLLEMNHLVCNAQKNAQRASLRSATVAMLEEQKKKLDTVQNLLRSGAINWYMYGSNWRRWVGVGGS